MSLHTIEYIIGAITLAFAYFISVTLVGAAEAYLVTKMGDDTPEQAGFLSLNPLSYIDLFGFLCTMLIGFGWGRILPFNPYNISEPRRTVKVIMIYLSQPFFSLLLALIALIMNVLLVGPQSLNFAFWPLVSKNVPLQPLAALYPHSSSVTLIIAIFLLSIVALNTFIAAWSFLNNIFHIILFLGAEHGHDYMRHAEALAFFGPLVVLLLFAGPLRLLLLKTIVYTAYLIATLFGAVL